MKPPLVLLQHSGISITGTKFNFDGVVYLNSEFQKPDGSRALHTVESEPVLVPSDVSTCTSGIKTELRFEETRRKQQDRLLRL